MKGPSIPVWVAKHIGTNILFSSAMLGELASKGKLKISSVKIGGSPLYYIPGQESDLQQYSKNLHNKEQKAYELLKEEKILRDKQLEPVIRVALRGIKDYAVALEVGFNGGVEIFWKWYLLSKEEAQTMISQIINPQQAVKEEPRETLTKKPIIESKEKTQEDLKEKSIKKAPETKPTVKNKTQEKSEIYKNSEKEKIKSEPIFEQTAQSVSGSTPNTLMPKEINAEEKKEPEQKKLEADIAKLSNDDFFNKMLDYFSSKEIAVDRYEIIRKASDIEFYILIPSPVGKIKYLAKARSKKNSNDTDLSAAFLQGQRKNLPVMYITIGKVTKKGKTVAEKEFPSMIIEEL